LAAQFRSLAGAVKQILQNLPFALDFTQLFVFAFQRFQLGLQRFNFGASFV
jgi:hypothetical protein